MESIGQKIAIARQRKRYTQDHLAKEIQIDQHKLSDIENDKISPSWELLQRISSSLDVPIVELLPINTVNIQHNTFNEKSGNFYCQITTDNIIVKELINRVLNLEKLINK